MLLKSNLDSIKTFVKRDNVLLSEEERYCYAQDALNSNDKYKLPDAVVFVERIEEIQNILRYANYHKIPVISRGAGTNMVGACTCPKSGIVLNFSKMNKILDFNVSNMTVKVQPGVILGDLKEYVEKQGLFFPPDPSNYKVSTIGGAIAQSSGGAKSFKYGTTKDYILSLTVLLADGTLMKLGAGTIKDAVGYHLNQLIVGSEGTLAIVVEAELKLIPLPEASAVITGYFDSIEKASEAVNEIIAKKVFPSAIEFMDNNTIKTIENFYPCGLDVTKEAMILIEVDGFLSSMKQQIYLVTEALKDAGAGSIDVAEDEETKNKIWTSRRSSFASTAQLAPDVISDDIIVPREKLGVMVTKTKKICDKYNLQVCIVGHVGDGNIHPQIAVDLDDEDAVKRCKKAKEEIYDMAVSLGGTISAEHGVGVEKMSYLNKIIDKNAIEYMKRIKLLFDPNNILNPDKIFKI